MTNLTQLKHDIEVVRAAFKQHFPDPEPAPPFDYDLIPTHERDLMNTIHLFHDVGVRVGLGSYAKCRYKFNYYDNPTCHMGPRKKCLDAMTPDELARVQLSHDIIEKWTRLNHRLTDEEKQAMRELYSCQSSASFPIDESPIQKQYWNPAMEERKQGILAARAKLPEAKELYKQIMAKYGEQHYFDCPIQPYQPSAEARGEKVKP